MFIEETLVHCYLPYDLAIQAGFIRLYSPIQIVPDNDISNYSYLKLNPTPNYLVDTELHNLLFENFSTLKKFSIQH